MDRNTMLTVCFLSLALSLVLSLAAMIGTLTTLDRVKLLEKAGRAHGHEININIPEDWLTR